MTYNADGLRTKRTNGTTTYNYIYLGGQLVKMTFGSNTITFNYDASGTPMSMVYNGTTYYYITNLQGDVTGITTKAGVQVVTYTYDAWGNLLSTTGTSASTIGLNNPLRYRGYVFDRETNLYYLQSRYYSPKVGRFISADVYVSTGQGFVGNNMFAYCGNNPGNNADPTGEIPAELLFLAGAAIIGVVNNTINAVYYEFSDGETELTSDSYTSETPSRFEKLDYTKHQTGEEHYNVNAWRYYSEYSVHEYGWYLTKWAHKKEIPLLSEMAEQFRVADVNPQQWDHWSVNLATVLWGMIGF